jgi:protein gp37
MGHPLGAARHWWDKTYNTTFGCDPPSTGCLNCYAARAAGTLQTATEIQFYLGTTNLKRGRYVYNGNLKELPPGHPDLDFPLRWRGARNPRLGAGMPSLLWAADMSELFLPGRSQWILDRTICTLAMSDHIGLLLTKLPRRMAAYFNAQPAIAQQQCREKLWLGFSAETQGWFDLRWPPMRDLAEAGWFVFVSIAPMIAPVTLPADFLALARWVIVSGEQGPLAHVRYLSPAWARAVRDQCAAAGVPFFLKQMSGKRPIPWDLNMQQFPNPSKFSRPKSTI